MTFRKHATRPARKFVPFVDVLEARNLLAVKVRLVGGMLNVTGTDQAETIRVRQVNNQITVSGVSTKFAVSRVSSVAVLGMGGDDVIDLRAGKADALRRNAGMWGGAGNDTITGGDGRNTIHGEAGHDAMRGGRKNDHMVGGDGRDNIYGGEGNDVLRGAADHSADQTNNGDTISGWTGDDTIYGTQGTDFLYGGAGNDSFFGSVSPFWDFDTVYGGSGDDGIYWFDGDLYGGDGNDNIAGWTILNGGLGNDTLEAGRDATLSPSTLSGDEGDDLLIGGGSDDELFGGSGNDTLGGDRGDDEMRGGDGDDRLVDNYGGDLFYGDGGWDYIDCRDFDSSGTDGGDYAVGDYWFGISFNGLYDEGIDTVA